MKKKIKLSKKNERVLNKMKKLFKHEKHMRI